MRWGSILFLLIVFTPAQAQEQQLKIRNVYIRSLGVFDPVHKDFQWWPFRALNRLHWKTQDSFIRKELLFDEGDAFIPDLVRESERNLRRYNFLTDISIRAERVSSHEIDLIVNSEDQWTTKPIFSWGKTKGSRVIDLGLEEENFLGLGKTVGFRYEQDSERQGVSGRYFDPALLHTRMRLDLRLSDFSDGHRGFFQLMQPFYAQSTKWSYSLEGDQTRTSHHLYSRGTDAAEIEVYRHSAGISLGRSWGERYRKRRIFMFSGYQELLYPSTKILDEEAASHDQVQANLYPEGKRLLNFGAAGEQDFQTFSKFTYLDFFGRPEDLPVGFRIGISGSHSKDYKGVDFATGVLSGRWAFQKNQNQYFVSDVTFSLRREQGGWNNYITDLFVHYYRQGRATRLLFLRIPKQTFATNFSAIFSADVDAPYQVSLGENEGLRGYSFKRFTGFNRMLINLEDRILLPWENRLLAFGIVPFADAGYVWGESDSEVGASVGIGLRFGFKKLGRTKVFRLDFALPVLHAEGEGISISLSTGQVFKVL